MNVTSGYSISKTLCAPDDGDRTPHAEGRPAPKSPILRRKTMLKKKVAAIAIKGFALLAVLGTAQHAMAQDATTSYPKMAPIEQYLMDRDAEIALARSAAPDAISPDASVIVLTRHGYETTVDGKSGSVCSVGPRWIAMFDHPAFWSPQVRPPAS